MPKDMMNNIDDLEMALENMDMDSIQDALNQLSEDMGKIEKDLDRYLEIFRRFQARHIILWKPTSFLRRIACARIYF